MFWASLVVFPLIASMMVKRTQDQPDDGKANLFLAYLFWLCAGFLGMHRFYLKSLWGLVYLPLFVAVIYGGHLFGEAREELSKARQDVEFATRTIDRSKAAAGRGDAAAQRRLADGETKLTAAKTSYAVAEGQIDRANLVMRIAAGLSLVLLLVDAMLIPAMVRHARATEPAPVISAVEPHLVEDPPPEVPGVAGRVARGIDTLVRVLGEFVAYWAVLAVFAYYFEVIGRYVFNSPTNWVHESTFLMFGMQYMIAGAYAYRGESHVRVDLIYSKLSLRGKAICDLIGSIFFFIFIGTMAWTGWTFAADAVHGGEVSFTEWGIQYWPVKLTIPLGAALLLLQGIARLIKDVHTIKTARG
ncbi:MAG TPA: TRAP transporter small permease subunit [Reyranella sp.]|nr:TRAP transporter small permease subunit [Reyranella sp.]